MCNFTEMSIVFTLNCGRSQCVFYVHTGNNTVAQNRNAWLPENSVAMDILESIVTMDVRRVGDAGRGSRFKRIFIMPRSYVENQFCINIPTIKYTFFFSVTKNLFKCQHVALHACSNLLTWHRAFKNHRLRHCHDHHHRFLIFEPLSKTFLFTCPGLQYVTSMKGSETVIIFIA